MPPMAEAAVCIQFQGIDNINGGVRGGKQARGLRDDNGDVGRGQGVDNMYKGLETTTEAAGSRRWA